MIKSLFLEIEHLRQIGTIIEYLHGSGTLQK